VVGDEVVGALAVVLDDDSEGKGVVVGVVVVGVGSLLVSVAVFFPVEDFFDLSWLSVL